MNMTLVDEDAEKHCGGQFEKGKRVIQIFGMIALELG